MGLEKRKRFDLGIMEASGTSQQIWNQFQSKLEQYDSKLDIGYEDSAYPAAGKYSQVYYWNQSSNQINPLIIGIAVATTIVAAITRN